MEALQIQLGGGTQGTQSLSTAMGSALNEIIHGAGQFGLYEQRAEIALPLVLQQPIQVAVGIQTTRPVVRTIRLLRRAYEIAQGIYRRVTTSLQFRIRHLQQEASTTETDV